MLFLVPEMDVFFIKIFNIHVLLHNLNVNDFRRHTRYNTSSSKLFSYANLPVLLVM